MIVNTFHCDYISVNRNGEKYNGNKRKKEKGRERGKER